MIGQVHVRPQRGRMEGFRVALALMALAGSAACSGAGREPAPAAPPPAAGISIPDGTHRSLFVMTTQQRPRISESLAAAGIEVTANLLEAGFTLQVMFGRDQGSKDCGTFNNVRYSLRFSGTSVHELVEKGWTGTCTPNVFDVLSERLAGALAIYQELQRAPREP